jgi:hypothetical protein
MPRRVERLHRHWTEEHQHLPPATRGSLAELDSGVIVTPPKRLEVGYMPRSNRRTRAWIPGEA